MRSHALFVIRNKALQVTNAEGLHFLRKQTLTLAMIFLRANSSGDRREHVVFPNLRCCAQEVAGHNQLHELFDLHTHWAAVGAGRLGALQTAQRLLARQFRTVA